MKKEQNANINNFNRTCFFCSELISGKKTLEHILSDSLLGMMGIKESPLHLVNENCSYIYSIIKVPAHTECNSGFGSQYESKVIKLISNPDKLYTSLVEEEFWIPLRYGPDDSDTAIISTWLAKIYYGLFYHDFLKTEDRGRRELSSEIIGCKNFDFIKDSYKNGYGFYLPSSLFVFRASENSDFDLMTITNPQCILIKVKKIVLILCIGDGFLVKNYLNSEPLENLRAFLKKLEGEQKNYPSHLNALAEILALWSCIPKSPAFMSRDHEILLTMSPNRAIDKMQLQEYRKEYLDQLFRRIM